MSTFEWSAGSGISETSEADRERFAAFVERYGIDDAAAFVESVTPRTPIVYWTMEMYGKDDLDIKGGGGLGVLAADTRRVAEDLGIPMVFVTPFYTEESHQELVDFRQVERLDKTDPNRLHRPLGRVAVSTIVDHDVNLDVFERQMGSTRVITITEPNFGELYPGNNNGYHRLYQEMALGFGGYEALKNEEYDAAFMQLNEAPTVFAAIAMLDDLCSQGVLFDEALERVKSKMLYTNHTLVQAVEGEFDRGQFEHMIMPNIANDVVKAWVESLFSDEGRLKLSSLAIELSGAKSGVSKLHAEVSEFYDANGEKVDFEAVTNGISDKWIMDEAKQYYRDLGAMDEFGLPTDDYTERLEALSMTDIRKIRLAGRHEMNETLAGRKDQYGDPIFIPEDALAFDFKRRFADYKRPDMVFSDPEQLAALLEHYDGHFLMTGKPHPNDERMKDELTRLLYLIDGNRVLKERVHYIQDYDEEVGRALSVGADSAINVPRVGLEACGTSFMKDIANFKILISTPDGGVADVVPATCLVVTGNEEEEVRSLYANIDTAALIKGDDEAYRQHLIHQLKGYLPVLSGPRMMGDYSRHFAGLKSSREALAAA